MYIDTGHQNSNIHIYERAIHFWANMLCSSESLHSVLSTYMVSMPYWFSDKNFISHGPALIRHMLQHYSSRRGSKRSKHSLQFASCVLYRMIQRNCSVIKALNLGNFSKSTLQLPKLLSKIFILKVS